MNIQTLGRIVALALVLSSSVAWGAADANAARKRGDLSAKPGAKTLPKARPSATKAARLVPARPSLG